MNKNVYVIGVFDLFHRGHVELLRRAKKLGDKLIVAINGDELVSKYKRMPYLSEKDRLAIVEACKYVDEAFIINQFDNKNAILKYKINIIVHGDDWVGNSYLEQIRLTPEFIQENNIKLEFIPYTKGISTSDLINKIKNS
ncbi:MAG: adenylyltransferase/cytidyltransferase family protein [Bacteroidaceae bacterium]|nr:adenylyltransferase/cytidyltransferase family protein [Bacteroidaceae bacterium]MEA5099154.1 adenylyltransferase/cytidyltransferase family protein [Bacteroidales bacterium]